MNILKDNAAPYILLLLVSGTGWLISNAYDELKRSHVIEYKLDYRQDSADDRFVVLTLTNLSQQAAPFEGRLFFRCNATAEQQADEVECFDPDREDAAEFANLGLISSRVPTISVLRRSATTSLRSIVGSSVRYAIPISSEPEHTVRFEVQRNPGHAVPLVLAGSGDMRVRIMRYFLDVTVWALLITSFLLGAAIIWSGWTLWRESRRAPANPGPAGSFRVQVERDDG